jgi:hypothetical protein
MTVDERQPSPSLLRRLVAMLYGDGGEGSIVGDSEIYVRLAEKMGIALSLLALKRKLRQV